ncbi:sensor histidine kinase [Lewinella sp. IMCC34183]|uniref:sensor histidine kinase n=1 Tax=Lewinella sp. IMCC34183 TaxID=2248762 RepID=UPI001300B71D|nr:sensor histidine kinase [Lewinella sp. IMCC34183]
MRCPSVIPLLLLAFLARPLTGQPEFRARQLDRAQALIASDDTDQALHLLDSLDADIPTGDATVASFQRRLRLTRARALIRARLDPAATEILIHLIDAARSADDGAVLAEATLQLAFLYQRQNIAPRTMELLTRADSVVRRYDLGSLRPELYNRLAGYYRQFGSPAEILPWAHRAQTVAAELHDSQQEALAHVNLSVGYRETDPRRSEYHVSEAARYYRNTGSLRDYFAMTLVLAGQKVEAGEWTEALAASDSSLLYVDRVIEEDSTYLHRVYELRAQIMHHLDRPDSAWYYLNLAHRAELDHLLRMDRQNLLAIQTAYESEKQALRIAEQAKTITYQRGRQQRQAVIFALVIAVLILTYFYTSRVLRSRNAREDRRRMERHNEQLSESLDQQKMLQGEIHHRVKNNLQIIVGLLQMQLRKIDDPFARSNLEDMANRIYSMAAVHEILYQQGRSSEIDFRAYAEKICRHFELLSDLPRACSFDLSLDGYWFNLETAIPLGTMFNELLTNSFKYGVAGDRPLRISVSLREHEGMLLLEYQDNGPGWSEDALAGRSSGLGSYLLKGMSRQLRGRVETANANGAVTRIWFRRKNEHKTAEPNMEISRFVPTTLSS